MSLPKLILAIDNLDLYTRELVIYLTAVFTLLTLLLTFSIAVQVVAGFACLSAVAWGAYSGWQWLVRWARRSV